MKLIKFILIALLIAESTPPIHAQEGNYYVSNFTPAMYGASDQNWCATQDSLGRMYFASLNGVLMYDGKFWKMCVLPQLTSCISLAKSADGTIFVGANGNFGFIKFNGVNGRLEYQSLSDQLPDKLKDFSNVWSVHCMGADIYYCSNERIFWYHNNAFKKSFTPSGEKFHTFFTVSNTLLVREQGIGFTFIKDGIMKKILGSGDFADVRVYAILPIGNNMNWICSRNGIFLMYFNPKQPEISNISKINCPLDNWLAENDVYCGTKLQKDLFALGSIKKGLILFDKHFKIHNAINYEKGLQDDAVKFIYQDYSGNIWLALNKGLSYAEINTPLTHWAKTNGIQGVIESVKKYNGLPYLATDKGVEVLNPKTNSFEPTGITDEGWDLKNADRTLLVGTNIGLYEIAGNKPKFIFPSDDGVFKILIPNPSGEIIFLAGNTSLIKAKYKDHKIIPVKTFEGAPGIRSIATGDDGKIFFGSLMSQVNYLDPNHPDSLFLLNTKDGLPDNTEFYVFGYKGEVLCCAATDTIYRFCTPGKPNKIKWQQDERFHVQNKRLEITRAAECGNDIWLVSNTQAENDTKVDELSILRKTENGFEQDYKMLKRIRELTPKCFLIDSGTVFIGTNDGLLEYNTKHHVNHYDFRTFVSKIAQNTDTTKLLENYSGGEILRKFEFPFRQNEIRFFVSASDYYDKNELEFQFYLEGRDTGFGEWSKASRKSYDALHEGGYTLHVKSRNILGAVGKSVSFSFTILPPWYRTYWAYFLYFVALILFVWFIVQYYTRRLKEQNVKLEKIITERTSTIAHQKEEIEHKSQEITDSINYAKRIQQAILPPIDEIVNVWNDTFVFYQPKDIVSGDFYWFHKISDTEILIACADCTGHGVPGGFMSMICSDKLNDAVKITQNPADILFHVNNNVKKALRQTEKGDPGTNKDGMEIALLRVNFTDGKIWYSGANRNLLILRKEAIDLEEVKPTKAGIASFTEMNFSYEGHELQLGKGDLVYLTSDGYPDQFGGADGKKFMTKNFKKLLLTIRNLTIREQEQKIKNSIFEWMGHHEQVDDLLVIGLKI